MGKSTIYQKAHLVTPTPQNFYAAAYLRGILWEVAAQQDFGVWQDSSRLPKRRRETARGKPWGKGKNPLRNPLD